MTATELLRNLLARSILPPEDWEALPSTRRDLLERAPDSLTLVDLLLQEGLLTDYQAARIRGGKMFGLILGNYRVLDRIGAGGMGIVYKAESLRLRRRVAVKVLAQHPGEDENRHLVTHFFAEMRTTARLRHPNIISAIDAGELAPARPELPVLHYYVMEYFQGKDLEAHVQHQGSLAVTPACDLISQAACALAEAHRHRLVHRDIKPGNMFVTAEGRLKLLDFGLVRHFDRRHTESAAVFGSVDFMAPEQMRDSHSVDIRADIYGLGATLFYCLTGGAPFSPERYLDHDRTACLTQSVPSILPRRPDVPSALNDVVRRMMAPVPAERYQTPRDVLTALDPFLGSAIRVATGLSGTDRRPVGVSLSCEFPRGLALRLSAAARPS